MSKSHNKHTPDWLAANAEEIVLSEVGASFNIDPASISESDLIISFHRLVLLYNLGRQICSETDEQQIFETILSAVSKLLNVERAFVATVVQGHLVSRATHNINLASDIDKWPVSSTMLHRVLREEISILTTDAMHDAVYGKAPSVDFHNIRSVICCPLGTRHKVKGLIYADNRISSGAFSRWDLEFLNALTHYALLAIEAAEERQQIYLEKELAETRWNTLREELSIAPHIVAASKAIVQLYGQAKRVARKDIPVMLVGETGTGKEVFARLIHESSPRARGPFIAVHVGSLSKSVVESELFGHEKGAFTGADRRRIGRFEIANGGTIFLDEVLDIPLDVQPKLLRVLEQRVFERVGSNEPLKANVRIICACNKPPTKYIAEGIFREDLYYRLNSVILEIPPLRDRPEDIIPLIYYCLEQCNSDKVFDDEALDCMKCYEWPGNVRELRNCVEALDALVEGVVIRKEDLPVRMYTSTFQREAAHGFEPLAKLVARIEMKQIIKSIEIAGGNNEKAIKLLGISRAKFFQRKKEYEL